MSTETRHGGPSIARVCQEGSLVGGFHTNAWSGTCTRVACAVKESVEMWSGSFLGGSSVRGHQTVRILFHPEGLAVQSILPHALSLDKATYMYFYYTLQIA